MQHLVHLIQISKCTQESLLDKMLVLYELQFFYLSSPLFFFSILNLFIGSWPTDTKWIIITFLFGIYGYFPLVFFIKAITTGKVGIVIPVIDMNIIYPIVLASIFLNQIISLSGIFFIFIILLGVVIFSINFSDFKESNIFNINSGVYYALIASLLWGLGYFFWSFSIVKIGALNTWIVQ